MSGFLILLIVFCSMLGVAAFAESKEETRRKASSLNVGDDSYVIIKKETKINENTISFMRSVIYGNEEVLFKRDFLKNGIIHTFEKDGVLMKLSIYNDSTNLSVNDDSGFLFSADYDNVNGTLLRKTITNGTSSDMFIMQKFVEEMGVKHIYNFQNNSETKELSEILKKYYLGEEELVFDKNFSDERIKVTNYKNSKYYLFQIFWNDLLIVTSKHSLDGNSSFQTKISDKIDKKNHYHIHMFLDKLKRTQFPEKDQVDNSVHFTIDYTLLDKVKEILSFIDSLEKENVLTQEEKHIFSRIKEHELKNLMEEYFSLPDTEKAKEKEHLFILLNRIYEGLKHRSNLIENRKKISYQKAAILIEKRY